VVTTDVKTDATVSRAGLRLVACAIFAACLSVVLMIPTPVAPRELPTLVVTHAHDAAQLAHLREFAARAPSSESARALEAAVAHAGRREVHHVASDSELANEDIEIASRRDAVITHDGRTAITALRSKAVLAFVDAFEVDVAPDRETAPIFGSFHAALARWGVVRDARLVAPALVVRVLYAARWNVIVRLPPTSGFGRAERRAYFGWLLLHAPGLSRDARRDAVFAFGETTDVREASEAIAVLEFAEDDFLAASTTFAGLARTRGDLRLRNAALAANQLAR